MKVRLNMDNNLYKKNIKILVIVLFIGLLLIGGTYAFLDSVSINVSDGRYNTTLECFDIDYDSGGSVNGVLVPSSTYLGGLNGGLSLGISEDCNVTGNGEIKLYVGVNTDDILTTTASPHCENKSTLQTIVDNNRNLIDEDTCNSNSDYKWETNGTALKYAFVANNSILGVGYINESDSSYILYDDFLVNDMVDYTVYVWLDGYLSDNNYEYVSFDGEVSSKVVQMETTS